MKGHIFITKEFQIKYVDILSSGKWSLILSPNSPLSLHPGLQRELVLLISKAYSMDKEQVQWRNLKKHYLNQVIKASITSSKSCWWHFTSVIWCDEDISPFVEFFPQVLNSSLIMGKTIKLRDILKNIWQELLNCQGLEKQRLRNCHRGDSRDMTAICDLAHLIGSQKSKRILVEENQDWGVGRHTAPPRTTRTDGKSNGKEVRHKGDKKMNIHPDQ